MLWAIFSGVFQYGYSMYVHNALQNALTYCAAYASRADICATKSTFSNQV
jgi:hypothetical protein